MSKELDALHQAGLTGAVLSGIGKAAAARTATEMILRERPDCMLNSGCAGGIAPGLRVLDIVVGAQTAYHDVWCGEGNLRGQVQGLPQRFDADPDLLRLAASVRSERPVHTGLICSGDQFLTTPEEDARVLDIYPDALACDMESASIAQVCRHYGVPFLSFRIISDVHDTAAGTETVYRDFWKHVADDSFSFLKQLLDRL